MIQTDQFGAYLEKIGFQWAAGVPCSFLENLINYSSNKLRYFAAINEGDAVALASGAEVGGIKTVVLMQNSGLTNAISPLTSLNNPFRIPLLGFVSLRGEPGIPDEPQHELMGRITTQLLDVMGITWQYLAENINDLYDQLEIANATLLSGKSFFFVVRKDTFGPEALNQQTRHIHANSDIILKKNSDEFPSRFDTLNVINSLKNQNTVQIVTTGKTARELFTIEDAPNNFYMVGSMGCASSFGLGLSVAQPNKKIVVIDGDGAILMRMGSLAMNGYYGNANLLHIVLDNQSYESTGGQQSISHNVNLVSIAAACGYTRSIYIHSLDELSEAIATWQTIPSLSFFHIKISEKTINNLGRPTVKPFEVKERLIAFLNKNREGQL